MKGEAGFRRTRGDPARSAGDRQCTFEPANARRDAARRAGVVDQGSGMTELPHCGTLLVPPFAFCLLPSAFIVPPSSFGGRLRPPNLSDRNLIELALAAIVKIDDAPRNHHGAEHRSQYPETV